MFMTVNPIPVKTAMAMLGACSVEMRLPLAEMSDSENGKLAAVLRKYGLSPKTEGWDMTNVLICGILGRMGKQLVESAAGTDVRVSCGVEHAGRANYPVFQVTLRLMRFVSASIASSIFPPTADYLAQDTGVCAVRAPSGGHRDHGRNTEAERASMRRGGRAHSRIFIRQYVAGDQCPYLSGEKCRGGARNEFDIEIIEMHHNRKLDAPSGYRA